MHREYTRIVPNAKTAVLMVHGIVGTPRHFDFLFSSIPEDVTVQNILLAGHGGCVSDFAKASMTQWRQQVAFALEQLCASHECVYIVAHSLGTLLTAEAAKAQPKVKGMLLLNVPLRVQVAPKMMAASLRWCFGTLRMDDPQDAALQRCSGVEATWQLWRYLPWIPRFWELLTICKKTRGLFETELALPVYAFQSRDDEVVRRSTSKHLLKNDHICHTILPGCGHFFYSKEAKVQICKALRQLLEEA